MTMNGVWAVVPFMIAAILKKSYSTIARGLEDVLFINVILYKRLHCQRIWYMLEALHFIIATSLRTLSFLAKLKLSAIMLSMAAATWHPFSFHLHWSALNLMLSLAVIALAASTFQVSQAFQTTPSMVAATWQKWSFLVPWSVSATMLFLTVFRAL